jgi:hypothetical protein
MLTSSVDGVYKAGYSIKQQARAYEAAVVPLSNPSIDLRKF